MLLILAGITITYVLGEDGIIAQAKLAAEKTRIANYQTVLEMIRAALEPEKALEELTTEEFLNRYEEMAKKEAENGALKGSTITGPQEDTKDKVRVQTKEGDVFEITEEGVEYKGNLSTNEILTSSITVSPTTAEIRVDGTVKLTATIEPSNATNKELTWTSDQTEIAQVIVNADGTATVTGKGAGQATITVTAQDSSKKSATCTVTVKAPVYYADVDGDTIVDGVIYADLAIGGSGYWYNEEYGSFTIPTVNAANLKEYTITQESYTGTFGTGKVLARVNQNDETKEDRFYVMALSDITSDTYWWKDAGGKISESFISLTSTDFGTGKTNTDNIMAEWNKAQPPYAQDSGERYKDMWGQIIDPYGKGWFVPSIGEWAAFAEALDIPQNKFNSDWYQYWSSSIVDSERAYAAWFTMR